MKSPHDSSLDLNDLLKPHVGLLIWIIFIGFGGGVLALYYAEINYFPEIAWKASLTYLAVISIVGGTIVVILSLLLFFPGYIWCRFLICDKLLENFFKMNGGQIYETCALQVIKHLGFPFLVSIILAHLLLYFESLRDKSCTPVYMLVGSFVLLVVSFFWIRFWFRKKLLEGPSKPSQNGKEFPSASRLFKYAFWFDVSLVVSFTAMYLIFKIAESENYIFLTISCVLIVFLSNCAVAVLYSKYSARAIAVSVIAATLMLFAADSSSSLTTKLMAAYGLGGEQEVTVVVDNDGCVILKSLDLFSGSCEDEEYVQLQEVQLLSRLGSEYFLQSGQKGFVLPKKNVISWSVERPP